MGQKIGKGHVCEAAEPFLDLPQGAVDELWHTEGWGLNPSQFVRLCKCLSPELGGGYPDEESIDNAFKALFAVFDTDKNDLIDALEFLATMAAISGMATSKKMTFIYDLYDFSENGELLLDEVTLLLRSTVIGLTKISKKEAPALKEFEELARLAVGVAPSADGTPVRDFTTTISRSSFVAYCASNPTMSSWLAHYDDVGAAPVGAAAPAALPTLVPPVRAADVVAYKARKRDWPSATASLQGTPADDKFAVLAPAEPAPARTARPDSDLTPSWVYGAGCKGGRGSAFYTATNSVAFHAAEFACVYEFPTEEEPRPAQKFMRAHDELVTALTLSADGTTVASGQSGADAKVVVWGAADRRVLALFAGAHAGAVAALAFSADASYLASADANRALAVWDLAARAKVAALTLTDAALGLCWTASKLAFVACGVDHVVFWTASGADPTAFSPKHGLVAGSKEARTHCCCGRLPSGEVVTATGAGELLRWKGRNCAQIVPGAHAGAVACLHVASGGTRVPLLVTGGVEGRVKVWRADGELSIVCQLDLATVPCAAPAAVCLHKSGTKVLVQTTGAELYELSALDDKGEAPSDEPPQEGAEKPEGATPVGTVLNGGALVKGPSGYGVTTLAAAGGKFLALGADGVVSLFDGEARAFVASEAFPSPPTCACLSPDGASLLVGLPTGKALVFQLAPEGGLAQTAVASPPGSEPPAEEGEEPAEVEAPSPVAAVQWAADGTAAVACGSVVHLFAGADMAPKGAPAPVSSVVTAMDFADGLLMVSTDDLDLHFISTEDGSILAADAAKEKEFQTSTVALAYNYKAVVASLPASGPADPLAVAASKESGLCVAGDRFGALNLLPYPCTEPAAGKVVPGHAPGVAGAAFLASDPPGLLTAGASDGCVIQWTLDLDERVDEADAVVEGEPAKEEEDEDEEGPAVPKYDPLADAVLVDDAVALEMSEAPLRLRCARTDDVAPLFGLEDQAAGEDAEVAADEATAAWRDSVAPPSTAGAAYLGDAVACDDLTLEWVHGYDGQSMRGNVRYAASGDVVYPAACLGIVLDKTERAQGHFLQHSDVITALATTADGVLAATGQVGTAVLVWGTEDRVARCALELLPGSRGCSALAFSPDGSLLAAAGQDDEHTLHVYSWAEGVLVAAAPSGPSKVLALAFSGDAGTLLYGASNAFGLGRLDGRTLATKRGIYGASAKRQAVTACAFVVDAEGAETAVVGLANGGIHKLDGRALGGGEKQHRGPVACLWACPLVPPGAAEEEKEVNGVGLVSGGVDGKVKLYAPDMEVKMEFDARKPAYGSADGAVASACLNKDRRKVLIGTRGSEIYELSTLDEADLNKGPLVTGHCAGSLKAVACHPILGEVATVGDDKTLRTWDLATHKQLRSLKLADGSRALGFLPNGHEIGVGLGVEGVDSATSGAVLVVSTLKPDLEIAKELKDASLPITCVGFSPDGECMAAGCLDTKIYVYDTLNSFALKCTCEGHGDVPRTLDFSLDSMALMSCAGAEAVVHDAKAGDVREGGLAELADEQWDAWTATVGWGVLGAYPAFSAATDVAATSRSPDKALLATADASGAVSLYRWPCVRPGAPAKTYSGHGAQAAAVAFTPKADFLASVGATDRCLFQWARLANGSCAPPAAAANVVAGLEKATLAPVVPPAPDVGDCAWKEEVGPPAEEPPALAAPPAPPALEFCYGVPAAPCSVAYNKHGDVVFAAGRLGVVYRKAAHAQAFFEACDKPVSAFAAAANGDFAAVCETGPLATVKVFDAVTAAPVASLPPRLRTAATRCAFSADGTLLAAVGVGLGGLTTICVWASPTGKWRDAFHLCSAPAPLKVCAFLAFGGPRDVVAGGVGEAVGTPDLCFYGVQGRNLVAARAEGASFAGYACGACVGRDLLAGAPGGALEKWSPVPGGAALAASEAAHTAGVFCVAAAPGGRCVSGGADGWVKVWAVADLEATASFFLGGAQVVALAVDSAFLKVAATTSTGALLEVVTDSGCISTLLEGEASGAFGLATKGGVFASCGDRGVVTLWDAAEKRSKASFDAQFPARALAFAPDSSHLAIGIGSGSPAMDVDGKFLVVDVVEEDGAASLVKVHEGHNAKAWISCAAYSPDGATLALGSADHVVYLHAVHGSAAYELYAVFDKHEGPIAALDFCAHSKFLRACSTSQQLLACAAASGEEAGLSTLADVVWATQTCPAGRDCLALWPEEVSDPAVAAAVSGTTLVAASHSGALTSAAYPAGEPEAAKQTCSGHGGPVAALAFSGASLLSAGALDGLVLQWAVPAAAPPEDPAAEAPPGDDDAPAPA